MVIGAAEVLAVIPARGVSRGLPGKNIRPLGGHPLIAYSIAAAFQAARVNRVMVSTDCPAIAEVGRSYRAEVPFLRPAELAQDHSLDHPLFAHLLEALDRDENYRPDFIVHLRPTSPLRPPGFVDEAVTTIAGDTNLDSVRSVTPARETPYKMWLIREQRLKPLLTIEGVSECYNMPRQALPTAFWQTGHVDVFTRQCVLQKRSLTGSKIAPMQIDRAYACDIDTPEDWLAVEETMASISRPIVRPE